MTELPSGIMTSEEVSSGMKSGGITTSRKPIWRRRRRWQLSYKQTLRTETSEASSYLTLHGVRVHLAHVSATVLRLDLLYVQIPRELVRVADTDPGIMSDYVLMYGPDGLCVCLDPPHLVEITDGGREGESHLVVDSVGLLLNGGPHSSSCSGFFGVMG